MNAIALRFYVHETRKHKRTRLFEWLLENSQTDRHSWRLGFHRRCGLWSPRVIHEQRFIELAADLPIMVEFIVTDEEADKLIEIIRRRKFTPSARGRRPKSS